MDFYSGSLSTKVLNNNKIAGSYFCSSSTSFDYEPDKYLYSQVTAVPGVLLDKDGHTVQEGYEGFINSWGDAISEEVLKMFSHTFLSSKHYFEHVHVDELIKGKIIDYRFYYATLGNLQVPLVDVLLATELKHENLIKFILSGAISSVSQGCYSNHLVCSKCGFVADSLDHHCDHIKNETLSSYKDDKGTNRILCNLLGNPNDPNSFYFFDLSWVYKPAFLSAFTKNILNDAPKGYERVASKEGTILPTFVEQSSGMIFKKLNDYDFSNDISNWSELSLLSAYFESDGSYKSFSSNLINKDLSLFGATDASLCLYYHVMKQLEGSLVKCDRSNPLTSNFCSVSSGFLSSLDNYHSVIEPMGDFGADDRIVHLPDFIGTSASNVINVEDYKELFGTKTPFTASSESSDLTEQDEKEIIDDKTADIVKDEPFVIDSEYPKLDPKDMVKLPTVAPDDALDRDPQVKKMQSKVASMSSVKELIGDVMNKNFNDANYLSSFNDQLNDALFNFTGLYNSFVSSEDSKDVSGKYDSVIQKLNSLISDISSLKLFYVTKNGPKKVNKEDSSESSEEPEVKKGKVSSVISKDEEKFLKEAMDFYNESEEEDSDSESTMPPEIPEYHDEEVIDGFSYVEDYLKRNKKLINMSTDADKDTKKEDPKDTSPKKDASELSDEEESPKEELKEDTEKVDPEDVSKEDITKALRKGTSKDEATKDEPKEDKEEETSTDDMKKSFVQLLNEKVDNLSLATKEDIKDALKSLEQDYGRDKVDEFLKEYSVSTTSPDSSTASARKKSYTSSKPTGKEQYYVSSSVSNIKPKASDTYFVDGSSLSLEAMESVVRKDVERSADNYTYNSSNLQKATKIHFVPEF